MSKYLRLRFTEKRDVSKKLKKTFEFAYTTYSGHVRKNGDTVFDHVLKSLDYLMTVRPDLATVQLCVLHEVFKVGKISEKAIAEEFGDEVLQLILQFDALSKVRVSHSNRSHAENLRQMLLVLAGDVRVVLVKLATRLHSLQTIEKLPQEKQKQIAEDVLTIYGPIADRLGVYSLKVQLEDTAFSVLEPRKYERITHELERVTDNNKEIIGVCIDRIRNILKQHKLKGKVFGRTKSIYSIAKKMKKKGIEHVGELYDIFALRVIVPKKEDCYRLFGFIHEKYDPVPNRVKDYIALPKINNYQSLHTTITNIYEKNVNRPVEIQIRTQSMDDIAEFGFASHSLYKETGGSKTMKDTWQKQLADLSKVFMKKGRFTEADTKELGKMIKKVFVLTPKGEIKKLSSGATPLDFAYSVHSDIGHTTYSAKVNGKVVPLSYELKTGDVVEVVTRKNHSPSPTSLLYAKTKSARQKIKAYLSEIKGEEKKEAVKETAEPVKKKPTQKKKKVQQTTKKLVINGHTDINYGFAKCCDAEGAFNKEKPLVAYMPLSDEIKIHARHCHELTNKEEARMHPVHFTGD